MNYCLNCGEPLVVYTEKPISYDDVFSETELNLITLTHIFVLFSWFYIEYQELVNEILKELPLPLLVAVLIMFFIGFPLFFDMASDFFGYLKKFVESILQGLKRKDAARIAFLLAFLASLLSWKVEPGILLTRSALTLLILVPFFDWINVIPVSTDNPIGKVIYPIIEMIVAAIFNILIKSS